MRNRLICFALSLVLTLSAAGSISAFANVVESGKCNDNVFWQVENIGGQYIEYRLTISGSGKMTDYEEQMDIPWVDYALDEMTEIVVMPGITHIGNMSFLNASSVESVSIPNTVESIGNEAFSGVDCLESIVVPEGVKTIGEEAFLGCYRLKNVTLPQSLTFLGKYCFSYCYELESVNIPSGLETISAGAFDSCEALENVAIPEGIKILDAFSFGWCTSLKTLHLPLSLTNVEIGAIEECTALTDVYYAGSKSQWKTFIASQFHRQELEKLLKNVTIHYAIADTPTASAVSQPSDEFKEPEFKSGTFSFYCKYGNQKGENSNSIAPYIYDDNYFSKSARSYNHELARMSMKLALSAYAYLGEGEGKDKYDDDQPRNVRDLMSQLGFEQISANDSYYEMPQTNSVGVIASNKKVAYSDGGYTIIALAVRGGNYGNEWGGNFIVGNGETHKGFMTARDHVLSFLIEYVKENGIKGNVKIWLTGYSRGGAVANLTAAYLNTHTMILGYGINISRENIYGYSFETPAGTRAADRNAEKYDNIFSIVNQNDFVPMVAPKLWNYGRYGITYFLPSELSNSDFASLKSEMYDYYNEYVGNDYSAFRHRIIEEFDEYSLSWSKDYIYPYFGFYFKEKNSGKSASVFFEELIDSVALKLKSPEYYTANLQEAMVYLIPAVLGDNNFEEFSKIFTEEMTSRLKPVETAIETFDNLQKNEKADILSLSLKATLSRLGVSVNDNLINTVSEFIGELLSGGSLVTILGAADIMELVHLPELCMAWLDSTDSSHFLRGSSKMCIKCPVDVEAFDSDGNLVGAIYSDVVKDMPSSTIIAYVTENGQKTIHLPHDENYSLKITATDSGEVSYSIEETTEKGQINLVNYAKQSVEKGDVLDAEIKDHNLLEDSYSLLFNGETITERKIIKNASVENLNFVADNPSDSSKLQMPENDEKWSNPFEDVKSTDWFFENVKYVSENGIMNGTDSAHFSPSSLLTRAMLVTVLYRLEGEPKSDSTNSNEFDDVKADLWYSDAVCWAKENGLVNGVAENSFAPDNNITREQFATIIYRYARFKNYDTADVENINILSYDDSKQISEYAISALQYTYTTGLIKGKTATTLNPKDNATRSEAAAILQRFSLIEKS